MKKLATFLAKRGPVISVIYVAAVALLKAFGATVAAAKLATIGTAFDLGLGLPDDLVLSIAAGAAGAGALYKAGKSVVAWAAKPSIAPLILLPLLVLVLPACSIINPPPEVPFVCSSPAPEPGKLVKAKEPASDGRVLVVLKQGGSPGQTRSIGSAVQVAARNPSLSSFRVIGKRGLLFSAKADKPALAALLKDPSVALVQENGIKRINVGWNLDRIDGRTRVLDGKYEPLGRGARAHVYLNDTGANRGSEFEGRMGDGHSAIGDGSEGWTDGNGHGSHVSGTMVGKTFGVANEATLHPCKSLTAEGSGTDVEVAECITWATDHAEEHGWIGQSVGNISLGGGKAPALDAALCDSIDRGMFWAVAAGNDGGPACAGAPADTDQAFTVAAVDRMDVLATFSNRGACVDGCAPGVAVPSIGGDLSGTSMASPHVAGVGAVLRGLFSELTPAQVSARILSMATKDAISGIPADTPNLMLYIGKE